MREYQCVLALSCLCGSIDDAHDFSQNVALYFICFAAPVLIQPIINLLTIRSWWDLHNGKCPFFRVVREQG